MKNICLLAGLVLSLSFALTAEEHAIPGGVVDNNVNRLEKVDAKDTQRLLANTDACLIEGRADVIEGDVAPIEITPSAGNVFIVVRVHLGTLKKGTPSISRYDYVLETNDDTQTVFECKGISAKSKSMVFETRPCPPVYGEDLDVFLLFEVPEKVKNFLFKLKPQEGKVELPIDVVKIDLNEDA